jgi:hypothetical protein
MRPIEAGPFSPITALATAFNAQGFTSTGAAVAPTTTATTDLLAHSVTLVAPVQATLAGVTFTLVGTDADGHPQSESGLVGPASGATVTSTKFYKTLTSIQPSATMGALTVSVGISAVSLSPTMVLDRRSVAAAAAVVEVNSGTINYTGYETFGNVFSLADNPVSVANAAFTAKTGTVASSLTNGCTGFIVLTNSVTNGAQYTIYVNQGCSAAG